MCPVFSTPHSNTNICLISNLNMILPGETVTIATTAEGIGMNAFQPNADIKILTEEDIY